MARYPEITASEISYEKWLSKFFERKVNPQSKAALRAFAFRMKQETFLSYYTRLFHESGKLSESFTPEQLEQGLWQVAGTELAWLLWGQVGYGETVPVAGRIQCIEAMYSLYRDLFARMPDSVIGYMWWDALRIFVDEEEGEEADPQIAEAMRRTMARILRLPSEKCRYAALHGLGHLEHLERRGTIRRWLRANPEQPKGMRQYAFYAMAGRVL